MKKKILVINFGGLGDQILFFPVLDTLKQVFSDSFITLITEPRSKSAIKLTDRIDELFICDLKSGNKFFETFKFLKKAISGKYDIIISSGSSKSVSILLFLTGIKKRIGYESGVLSRILLTEAVFLNQNQYAADMYHNLVFSLDAENKSRVPDVKITLNDKFKDYLDKLIPAGYSERKKIVIHPGVSKLSMEKNILKFWHAERWAEFIKKLLDSRKYTVILTGGPDDQQALAQIRESTKDIDYENECLLDLSDKNLSIEEFVYIVKLSDTLVCVDSAPMHIAVGLKKPVIALFGPTNETKLLPPENNMFTAVKNDKMICRPCLWDKRQTCCEYPDCLDIEVEHVLKILENKPAG